MTPDILIAEDDADMQELIRRSLPEGVDVQSVRFFSNGQEILDYLFKMGRFRDTKRSIPGLIVLDLDIPLVNGRAVISILKSDERFKRVPAVILTGNTMLANRLRDLGADDYFVKPMSLEGLKGVFEEINRKWLNLKDAT